MSFDKDYREIPITFERGLVESVEDSMLPPGAAAQLTNWHADPTGGLRTRLGWLKGSTTSAPATRKGVGVGYFSRLITPSIVQSSTVATGSTSCSPAWPAATTKGNLLVLVAGVQKNSTSSIATPAGWTLVTISADISGRPQSAIFYKQNADSMSGSVTVTHVSSNVIHAQLIEVSAMAEVALDRAEHTNSASDATPDSGTTLATTQPVEFCIGIIVDERDEAQTGVTNGYTQLSQTQSGGSITTSGVYYKITSATGAQSFAVTTATADETSGAIATFKGWFSGTPAAGQTSVTEFLAAQNDTTQYLFYAVDRDTIATDTWANTGAYVVGLPSQLVAMAPGFGRVWFTNPQFATLCKYDGVSVSVVTAGPAGRCVAVHKQRVWVAGTNAKPGRIYFSEVNDGTTWPTLNYLDLDAEGGEPIEDIAPFEDGLIVGKRTAVHYILGSGVQNLQQVRLPIGGAAPGRSITPTPYGAIIAGRGNIWLYSGGSVEMISTPVEMSWGMTDSWVTGAFINDRYYLCDQGTGDIWSLNMRTNTGAWHKEIVHSGSTEPPSCIYSHDDMMVYSPKNATVGSLLNYRIFPDGARAKDFDTLTEAFTAWTPEIWPTGPEQMITPRYLYLKIRQRGGTTGQTGITITPVYDGRTQTAVTFAAQAAAGVYRQRKSIAQERGISSVQFKITQTVPSGEASVCDIEEMTLGFNIEPVM